MKCLKCKSNCLNETVSYGGRLDYNCFSCGEQYRLVEGRLYPYRRQPTPLEMSGRSGRKDTSKMLSGKSKLLQGGEIG
jgi:hypothetical protein